MNDYLEIQGDMREEYKRDLMVNPGESDASILLGELLFFLVFAILVGITFLV